MTAEEKLKTWENYLLDEALTLTRLNEVTDKWNKIQDIEYCLRLVKQKLEDVQYERTESK